MKTTVWFKDFNFNDKLLISILRLPFKKLVDPKFKDLKFEDMWPKERLAGEDNSTTVKLKEQKWDELDVARDARGVH